HVYERELWSLAIECEWNHFRNTGRAYLACFAAEPALLHEIRGQGPLECTTRPAVQQIIERSCRNRVQLRSEYTNRLGSARGFQRKPVKRVRAEREKKRLIANDRELGAAEQLHRHAAAKVAEVEIHVLHETREVHHNQQVLVPVAAQKR